MVQKNITYIENPYPEIVEHVVDGNQILKEIIKQQKSIGLNTSLLKILYDPMNGSRRVYCERGA